MAVLDLTPRQVVVIGGGAAGYFGAIHAARHRGCRVTLLEATRRTLTKVRISGGGRCNVTHHAFDPVELVRNYPRGGKELRGAFTRFQPRDTLQWFSAHGVELKAEADGRMFPVTDDSQTIVDCLERAAAEARVEVRLGASVQNLARRDGGGFALSLKDGSTLAADRVLLATGSAPAGYQLAASLGHVIEPLVPSLFTFNVKDPRLTDLLGVAFPDASLQLTFAAKAGAKLERRGPLLITHWGLSGPAVLKLSAFGAVPLHAAGYKADLCISFMPDVSTDAALATLRSYKDSHPKQSIAKNPPFAALPRRFWARLVEASGLGEDAIYADLARTTMQQLAAELTQGRYQVQGKGVFKEEFVTAGGVRLKDVDFRTMESRLVPGLHFAGEVLDVDGITGGFNFQAAWTTSYLAAEAMASAAPR